MDPRCKYFGECGGCSFQQIPYATQLEDKRALLAQVSGREHIAVFSDVEYGYRNRLDMGFHDTGIGFRKKGNWRQVLDIENCPIATTGVNTLINEVRTYFSQVDGFNPKTHQGTFHHALLRATSVDTAISIVLNKDSVDLAAAQQRVKDFAAVTSASHLLITYVNSHSGVNISEEFEVIKGSSEMEEQLLGKRFSFSIQGFFQNNGPMAEQMHRYCHEVLKQYPTSDCELLDLYGGVGTFAIINSALFKKATTLESFAGCIDSAKINIEKNSITNVSAVLLDAKNLRSYTENSSMNPSENRPPLYILIDPPRGGMHAKTVKEILRLKPALIVFVCCNVPQLREYLPQFEGYSVKSAALFDLFPQTPHCEGILELVPTTH